MIGAICMYPSTVEKAFEGLEGRAERPGTCANPLNQTGRLLLSRIP